jgi:NAD(P)-dependent dehydrogenase (short-subunit alcohol dehydrogenase family)
MTYDMDGKAVVITGGAGGIGAAVARRFATARATLVLGDLDAVGLEELAGPHAAPITGALISIDYGAAAGYGYA